MGEDNHSCPSEKQNPLSDVSVYALHAWFSLLIKFTTQHGICRPELRQQSVIYIQLTTFKNGKHIKDCISCTNARKFTKN